MTAAMSSDSTRWSRSDSGHSPFEMSCASPSTIAVLPTPGSPISTGLFFLRRVSTSMTRWISFARPIVGSSWPSAASWVRSRQKWSSAGVLDFFSPFGARLGRRLPARLLSTTLRHLRSEDAQCLGAGGVEIDARVGQYLRRNPLFFTEKPKQEVLSADVAVVELARLAHRELEHFLGARRVRKVGPGRLTGFALLDRLLDFLLDVVQLDAEVLEDRRRDALALANQSEQDVLSPHVFVVETGGLLARHRENFPHPLGEVIAVHGSLSSGRDVQPFSRPRPLPLPALYAHSVRAPG